MVYTGMMKDDPVLQECPNVNMRRGSDMEFWYALMRDIDGRRPWIDFARLDTDWEVIYERSKYETDD